MMGAAADVAPMGLSFTDDLGPNYERHAGGH